MRRISILTILGAVVLLGTPVAWANTTCGNAQWLLQDGNTVQQSVSDVTSRFFQFRAEPNRSYSITVDNVSTVSILATFVQAVGTGCTDGAVSGAVAGTVTVASTIEPWTCPGGFGCLGWGNRNTITSTAEQPIFFQVVGLESSTMRVRVEETTLFNPRWSTFSGFNTSWGFHNTTTSSITVNFKVIRTTGEVLATDSFSVPAGRVIFRSATGVGVAADRAGGAVATHNGPPGAIQVDGFMVSPDGLTGFAVKFETRPSNQRSGA